MPITVSAATIALIIASSVASTVALKTVDKWLLGNIFILDVSFSDNRSFAAVEKARKISPEPALLTVPSLPSASDGRFATRLN